MFISLFKKELLQNLNEERKGKEKFPSLTLELDDALVFKRLTFKVNLNLTSLYCFFLFLNQISLFLTKGFFTALTHDNS